MFSLARSRASPSAMLSSAQPSAFSAQLDYELHLQHIQLNMFNSAQPSAFPAQLDHELHLHNIFSSACLAKLNLQHSRLSSTMSSTFTTY
ncbi:hypothetical protein A2U01_0068276, partial [Trifolium medium]|nr:hypothetical protein [Trifolium medium]